MRVNFTESFPPIDCSAPPPFGKEERVLTHTLVYKRKYTRRNTEHEIFFELRYMVDTYQML